MGEGKEKQKKQEQRKDESGVRMKAEGEAKPWFARRHTLIVEMKIGLLVGKYKY